MKIHYKDNMWPHQQYRLCTINTVKNSNYITDNANRVTCQRCLRKLKSLNILPLKQKKITIELKYFPDAELAVVTLIKLIRAKEIRKSTGWSEPSLGGFPVPMTIGTYEVETTDPELFDIISIDFNMNKVKLLIG